MATITATGTGNWTLANTAVWVGGVVPTAADDVVIPTGASLTIPAATTVPCRSWTIAGTGALAGAATTSVLNTGDATAGTGNIAINIGPTGVITNTAVWQINLISTSSTQQTINSGGKTLPNININGAGSSYLLSAALTMSGTLIWTQGIFNTGNFAMQASAFNLGSGLTRTVTLGSSAITATAAANAWIFSNLTNLTTTANTAVITCTGTSVSTNNIIAISSWNSNGASFVITGGGVGALSVLGATVNNFTITGTASQTDSFRLSGNFTVSGTLTLNGNSAVNRPLLYGATLGSAFTITAANTSISNFDFMDITAGGAGAWTTTSGVTGDRQGNTGITFTTPATQTRDSTAAAWSVAARWTSRVPLPQDDVVINSGSGNITSTDVLCMGKSINFTGYTGTITLTSNASTYTCFGNITLGSGMNYGVNPNTFNIEFRGRGAQTITSNGKALFPAGTNASASIIAPTGSYTLADPLLYATPTSAPFQVTAGTFNSNNINYTVGRFISTGTNTRALNTGTSTVTLTSGINALILALTSTGMTASMLSTTFTILNVSVSTRSVDLGGVGIGTFNYTVAGSTGQLSLISAGYIDTFNFSDATNARTLAITSNVTASFNNFNVLGTTGKLMTVTSITSGTPAYVEILGTPIVTDYLSVKDIYAVIPYKFYAGLNSTNVSGNTSVEFTATPATQFISLRADNTASNLTTITATFPFGLSPVAGRKIIVGLAGNQTSGTITPPAGFTQVANTGTAPFINLFEKVATGSETTLTFTTTNTVQILTIKVFTLGGFTGTATLDVSDTNSGSAVTSLNTAGTAPSNTANPAIALGFFQANNTMGNSVSATNSFAILRDSTELTSARVISKYLTSNAAVSSTYTWTTARNAVSLLAVYRDSTLSNVTFITYKPPWRS